MCRAHYIRRGAWQALNNRVVFNFDVEHAHCHRKFGTAQVLLLLLYQCYT